MPQMDLTHAQELIEQLVENPDGPAARAIPDRRLVQALATVLVRNQLLFPAPEPTDG